MKKAYLNVVITTPGMPNVGKPTPYFSSRVRLVVVIALPPLGTGLAGAGAVFCVFAALAAFLAAAAAALAPNVVSTMSI